MRAPSLIMGKIAQVLVLMGLLITGGGSLRAESAIRLAEAFPPGYLYHVSCRVDLAGTLALPAEKGEKTGKTLPVKGDSAIEYDERVLDRAENGKVKKTIRRYHRIDFLRKVGNRPQDNTVRSEVRRLVVLRNQTVKVPFSPDGPLLWNEIDLVRTDVFTPALVGLLPTVPVRKGDRWKAANAAIQELTDLHRIENGAVNCKFEQITELGKRRLARIAFSGSVMGTNEDGPNRQRLEGYLFFDLGSRHISYLFLKGTNQMLDKEGKTLGTVVGRFTLTRQLLAKSNDLSNQALRGVDLKPNPDNTLLLYDNAELGLRFLYPRRWRVAGTRGRQVAVDETRGSGLLITVEPLKQTPTSGQFLTESRSWLLKQKARILRIDQPRRVQKPPYTLDWFALDTEMARQRIVMDYYVAYQAQGGATIAARLLPADIANVRKDVERIVRSLRISKPNGTN